jgi:hypothetical protein
MPSNIKTSVFARNIQLNALAPAANHGFLRIYSGIQPSTPETAYSITGQVCLCELRLNRVAFSPSKAAILIANPIADDIDARASGKASWYRVFQADGVTALWDGSVGVEARDPDKKPDLILNSVDIQQHAKIMVTEFNYSIPI